MELNSMAFQDFVDVKGMLKYKWTLISSTTMGLEPECCKSEWHHFEKATRCILSSRKSLYQNHQKH